MQDADLAEQAHYDAHASTSAPHEWRHNVTPDGKARLQLVLRSGLRLGCLIVILYGALQLSHYMRNSLQLDMLPDDPEKLRNLIAYGTVVFVVLLAIPFVPGAEIGFAMLTLLGPQIVPVVYGATLLALLLAFAIGQLIPPRLTIRILRRCGLHRAAGMISEIAVLPKEQRLNALFSRLDGKVARQATRYRYVAIGLLINMPGNVIIGGGGGIAMVAGITRIFSPLPFLLTIAIAIVPLPLATLLMGR